jgi:hypothetical protein
MKFHSKGNMLDYWTFFTKQARTSLCVGSACPSVADLVPLPKPLGRHSEIGYGRVPPEAVEQPRFSASSTHNEVSFTFDHEWNFVYILQSIYIRFSWNSIWEISNKRYEEMLIFSQLFP